MSPLLWAALGLAVLAATLGVASVLDQGRRKQRADATLRSALHAGEPAANQPVASGWWQQRLADLAAIGEHFEGSRLQKALIAPEDRLMLEQINQNTRTGQAAFLGIRLLLALLTPLLLVAVARPQGSELLIVLMIGLAGGVLLPKFVLRAWAMRLKRKVDEELPLLVDLLRLLQGVGFSIDQSLQMVGNQLRVAVPVLGRELQQADASYTRGRSREQSLRRLSESFDNEELRSLVQLVLQVHQHGGAVQEPLRQFGMRLREQRRMRLKEKVGKLSVKMTVVMMLTLLPALMLVLSGPAIVSLAAAIKGM